ncbi:MAG: iron-sulfur cluster insertion protein ErpA [Gammaproteobacteria bacterium]|jgi:iron-sulfur cluster insertion protein
MSDAMLKSEPAAPTLDFTLAAAQKVYSLIQEEGNPQLNLRAYIVGGGCSGFQYGFTFDEVINADDQVIEKNLDDEDDEGGTGGRGLVKLLIDPMSFQYLMGAQIDYTEGIEGAQFVIRNPNAQTTCGCGSSFSV